MIGRGRKSVRQHVLKMIENKCSFTRLVVVAASSNENFSFNLCVKSVETAYGRATKNFENGKIKKV